ncbi:MAG: murein transglycosylase [Bdellovibrionaceae bacterium]|nr:murein transglycosylase [Pseudobdellovibrionaceae bacterium]|tara:strand:- start:1647 stop:2696 length:1050 start_codon:yes stop_codon:yes gene_type:complete
MIEMGLTNQKSMGPLRGARPKGPLRKALSFSVVLAFSTHGLFAHAATSVKIEPIPLKKVAPRLSKKTIVVPKNRVRTPTKTLYSPVDRRPFFDIPVTYNSKVKFWIRHFQGSGHKWFRKWLERSNAYLPLMKNTLAERKLPQDLAYVAMIESGFSAHATSTASAVGYWQFIKSTGKRYGLKIDWWIDERRDHQKSTVAAARYLGDLYKIFGSWYLTAAAYNMGEGRLGRLIKKHGTKNYWVLSQKSDFPKETKEYIPKLLAAMMISKAPKLYGFKDLSPKDPYSYDYFFVPGGTDLMNLASYLDIDHDRLSKLNPELLKGFVPSFIRSHRIRIPKGFSPRVTNYLRAQL